MNHSSEAQKLKGVDTLKRGGTAVCKNWAVCKNCNTIFNVSNETIEKIRKRTRETTILTLLNRFSCCEKPMVLWCYNNYIVTEKDLVKKIQRL